MGGWTSRETIEASKRGRDFVIDMTDKMMELLRKSKQDHVINEVKTLEKVEGRVVFTSFSLWFADDASQSDKTWTDKMLRAISRRLILC